MRKIAAALFTGSLLVSGPALAVGDAAAGEAKSATCAACHGQGGVSVIPAYPHLAGQVPGFITTQLTAFRDGDRVNAQMSPMAAGLSDQDIADLDAYYAQQPAPQGAIAEGDTAAQELAEAGGKLYRGGDSEYGTPPCLSCHGPAGAGLPTNYPRVAGQPIEYLKSSLLAYKNGSRHSEEMNKIAFTLSEQQIDALAHYIHALY